MLNTIIINIIINIKIYKGLILIATKNVLLSILYPLDHFIFLYNYALTQLEYEVELIVFGKSLNGILTACTVPSLYKNKLKDLFNFISLTSVFIPKFYYIKNFCQIKVFFVNIFYGIVIL